MCVADGLVHWFGILDAVQPDPGDRPPLRDQIGNRQVGGVPALSADVVREVGGFQILDQRTATNMTLVDPERAPWPGLELAGI